MNTTLIYPMFALVVLTYLTLLIAFCTRVLAVRQGRLKAQYFKTFSSGEPPEAVVKTGRHFSNLFEIPVLFYAGCLAALILGLEGFWVQFWAWLFVAARIVHAYIHMGPNKIPARMASYMVGCLAVLALWVQVVLSAR